MDITYLGHSSFRIKGKNASVITDPFDPKMVGLKYPGVNADIVTISHDHADHNQAALVKGVKMVVAGPGEYEIMGVSIIGIATYHDEKKGELRGKNTVYLIEIDRLRVVHLGDLGHKLSDSQIDILGNVDILMVPVGGEYTIGPAQAAEIARNIESKIILPMHYQMKGLDQETFAKLSTPGPFLTDIGASVERLKKLTVKKENIGEEQRVIVLEKK